MKRTGKRLLFAAMALTLASVVPVVATENAHAAENQGLWNRSLEGVTADRIFTHSNGNVTVAACGAKASDTSQARTYSPSGTVLSNIPNSNSPKLYGCMGESVIGRDDTLFVSGRYSDQSYSRLFAYKSGAPLWQVRLPNGCQYFTSTELGTNGNVYVVATGCSGAKYRLVGYAPQLDPGATEPSIVMNAEVANTYKGSSSDGLGAHPNGLVVRLRDGLQFFSYSGTSTVVAIASPGSTGDDAIAVNAAGRAFYPIAATSAEVAQCASPVDVATRVEGRTQTGLEWQYKLPPCSRVIHQRAGIDGGLVIETYRYDARATVVGRWLASINEKGIVTWVKRIDDPNDNLHIENQKLTVTASGDVVMQGNYLYWDDYSMRKQRFGLTVYSGRNGAIIASQNFEGVTYGYSHADGSYGSGLANGRAYVALSRCTYLSCGNERKLYALDIPVLRGEYPRSVNALGWLNYVALGDSFSSGEGDAPFEPATDTAGPPENRCHRSGNAYPRLLSGNPRLRWNLTNFAACSGATSTIALNEAKPGAINRDEGKQIDKLNAKTDIVTITMGGNDIGFAGFVLTCLLADCSKADMNREYFDAVDGLQESSNALQSLYEEIRGKSPSAKVSVMGYPQLLPNAPCLQTDAQMKFVSDLVYTAHLDPTGVVADNLRNLGRALGLKEGLVDAAIIAGKAEFNQTEVNTARSLVEKLNSALGVAVVNKLGASAKFIDPNKGTAPFRGHELCTANPYFVGVDIVNFSYSFHPNRTGQEMYAKLIASSI